MDAAALVKQARHRAGLSQRVVAERAGVRRQTVAQIECGARRPSIPTLVSLLAAAGVQMRIELEPLDADVRRAIEERRARGDDGSDVAVVWAAFHRMDEVAYRIEGLAAAALLGAPVPVPTIDIGLAETTATYEWLAARMRCHDVAVRADGWVSPLKFPLTGDGGRDGAVVRDVLGTECPEGRFWLEGWFDRMAARLAPEPEVARCVRVETSEGTIPVQPLDDIVSEDTYVARVLRVMRQG